MIIEKKDIKNYAVSVAIRAEKQEFDDARMSAYAESTDRYPVPGYAGGLAPLAELEKLYGPAVLYDEALEIVIPKAFGEFLSAQGLRVVGKPQVADMQFAGGGVVFEVKADLYPDIELGQYRNIMVPFRRGGEQEQFELAVIQKACENMRGEIPPHMVEQKMASIVAREKLNAANESIYHLLADALVILREAYEAAGAVRPVVQIRREAMDLMLQTVSRDHAGDWKDFFRSEIRTMAERYHELPADYDTQVNGIIDRRMRSKNAMQQDELIDEIFKAYLGSLELTEEQWKNQRQLQAAKEVCVDLLLDAVAREEKLTVSPIKLRSAIEDIAASCNMSAEEVEASMDTEPLRWKLLRDEAMALVLDSAGTDEVMREQLAKEAGARAEETRRKAGEA